MIKLLLLLLSGAKFGKLLTTGGTMLLSVIAYAWLYGWRYAAGFVLLLFCHEMGHYVAARQRGLAVGLPTFIPFVGAWTQLGSQAHDAETTAYVGIMGPLTGTLASLLCYFWARNEGSQLLLAISYSGFFLNLLNLIPSPPFDGGHVTAAISRRIWFVGVPVMVGLFLWRPSPLLILVVLLAAPQIMRAIKNSEEDQQYYNIPLNKRLEYAALYIGLLAYLGVMTQQVHDLLVRSPLQS